MTILFVVHLVSSDLLAVRLFDIQIQPKGNQKIHDRTVHRHLCVLNNAAFVMPIFSTQIKSIIICVRNAWILFAFG